MGIASPTPISSAAVVAQAAPAMPMSNRKMKISFRIGIRSEDGKTDRKRDARASDAIEIGDGRPQRRRERPADHARNPEIDRERLDVRREPEGADHGRPEGDRQSERGNRQHGGPEAEPCDLARAPVAAGAVGLRDQRLHAHRDAADHEDREQGQPVDRGDRRRRRGREPADEPRVGEIQHRLHRAVQHERKRKHCDRTHVDLAPALGVELDGGQGGLAPRGAFRCHRCVVHA